MTERHDSNYYEGNPTIDEQLITKFRQYLLGQHQQFDQPLLEIQKQFAQNQSEQDVYKLRELLNNLQLLLSNQHQLLNKNHLTYDLQEPLNNQQQSLQQLLNEQQQLLKQLQEISGKPQPLLQKQQKQLLKKLRVLSDKLQRLQSQQQLLQQLQNLLEERQENLNQQLQFIEVLGQNGILYQQQLFINEQQQQQLFNLLQKRQDILLNKRQSTQTQLDIIKSEQLFIQREQFVQEQVTRQINCLEIGENCTIVSNEIYDECILKNPYFLSVNDPKNTKNTHDEKLESKCRELEIKNKDLETKNKELKRNSNSYSLRFFSDNGRQIQELQSENDKLKNKCQILQANCQNLQTNCQILETHRDDLKKANEKLKKEAIKYQSALGNATSFHLGSQDSDSAGQLSDDIRTLHNNLEKFCGLKRGGEVKEPEVKKLLEKFGCSITGKINKDHKNLISGLLERYVIETIIEKAKEYFCVQKNDKDNKNDEEQPKGNDDKKLKENDEKTEKTQVDNDKPSKGNDGEKQNGNDGEQDDEKKQQSLEVNIVNTTERLLKMIDSISTSRVGNDEVSKAASTKLRQQIYGVLGNR